ncbi:zinc ribbon domain-containing protein [Aphanothece sacrum]|uniref:zinc ribbon domain-containing protein n=1 Tax=Aphanothece sacrum TaxID=1122 RepID=UPI003F65E51D
MGLKLLFTILEYVCSQTDTYLCKVDKNYTSQICPNCGTNTGKKELTQRVLWSFFIILEGSIDTTASLKGTTRLVLVLR